MPEIAVLSGLSFCLYFMDNQQHNCPHVHVKYGSYEIVIAIENGSILAGYMPSKQRKRAEQHIALYREKLLIMWEKAVHGKNPGKL